MTTPKDAIGALQKNAHEEQSTETVQGLHLSLPTPGVCM